MRLSRIDIERFLGFKKLEVDIDHALQLIAGPNNAGKSSLIRLIDVFFSDPKGDDLVGMLPLNDYYAALGPRTLSSIQLWFSDLSVEEKQAFAPLVRQDGRLWFSIRCSRGGNMSYRASRDASAELSRRSYEELLNRFQFVKIPSVRVTSEGQRGEAQSLERFFDTLEGVLIRSGATRSTLLQQEFASAIAPVEALVKRVLDESAAAIAGDLPFREQNLQFSLSKPRYALRGFLESTRIESSGDVTVSVAERGTGFQSALVLGILKYVAAKEANHGGNLLFAIEEPEAFLHPQTQRAMAKIIGDVANEAQILLTTHSSVLVDSFSIGRIARLPLDPSGLVHTWNRPKLDSTVEGRLTRYCNAANSELVFANSVLIVEGEGDFLAVEKILSHVCGAPGGHYALGITVINADGIGNIQHLVGLARHFGVRSFAVADKDGVLKVGGQRKLLTGLAPYLALEGVDVDAVRRAADQIVLTLDDALGAQEVINLHLAPVSAFVMSSDLEGLLFDSLTLDQALVALGSSGESAIDATFEAELRADPDGPEKLRMWGGSKGWNADKKPLSKLAPHLSPVLMDVAMAAGPNKVLKPFVDWIQAIVDEASKAPL
jgi:putative ATP-dependent endonuclease of OLD family